jgi:hypothetical protein
VGSFLTQLRASLGKLNVIVTHKALFMEIVDHQAKALTEQQSRHRAFAAGLIIGDQQAQSIPRDQFRLSGTMPCDERLDDLTEESRRQKAVVIPISAANLAKIIARPIELVTLGHHDPGARIVKPEMPFDRGRNLDRAGGIGGLRMRDGQHHHDRCFKRRALDREHDHARAILASFFPSGFVFVVPQIGIGDDKARLRRRDRHRL